MALPEVDENLVNRVNETSRRMRQIEENLRNITAQIKSIENDIIEQKQNFHNNKTDVNTRIEQLADTVANIKVDINNLNRHIRKLVSKREIKEIESYMKIMSPMNSAYLTKSEIEKLIEEKMRDEV